MLCWRDELPILNGLLAAHKSPNWGVLSQVAEIGEPLRAGPDSDVSWHPDWKIGLHNGTIIMPGKA